MDFQILNSLSNLSVNSQKTADVGNPGGDFAGLVQNAVNDVFEKQKTAEALSTAVANGEPVNTQDVIRAISAAELNLQTMVTVRDRAVEAYQEIIRMPI